MHLLIAKYKIPYKDFILFIQKPEHPGQFPFCFRGGQRKGEAHCIFQQNGKRADTREGVVSTN